MGKKSSWMTSQLKYKGLHGLVCAHVTVVSSVKHCRIRDWHNSPILLCLSGSPGDQLEGLGTLVLPRPAHSGRSMGCSLSSELFCSMKNLGYLRVNTMPWCCEVTSLYKVNNNITGENNASQSARKNFAYASLTAQPSLSLSNELVPCSCRGQIFFPFKLPLALFASPFPSRLTLGKCWVFTISLVIKSHHPACIAHYCSLIRVTSTALSLKQ